jgi:hypothetical protein
VRELMALVDAFGIDVYSADSPAPRRYRLDPASFDPPD